MMATQCYSVEPYLIVAKTCNENQLSMATDISCMHNFTRFKFIKLMKATWNVIYGTKFQAKAK